MKASTIKTDDKTKLNSKIVANMKSYANDPYFIKKGKESKEFLERVGFPEEFLKNR